MKASQESGVFYRVKKFAEIVFNRGRMVKAEGLDVFAERMKALNPEKKYKNYEFLGCDQAEQIDTDTVYERVKA